MICLPRVALGLSLTLGVLGALAQQAEAGRNLLVNDGLAGPALQLHECASVTGRLASSWQDNSCWMTPPPSVSYGLDTTGPHGGTSAQAVTLNSGAAAQLLQTLRQPTADGEEFEVRLWLRSASAQKIIVQLRQTGAPYAVYGQADIAATPGWASYSFPALASTGSTSVILLTSDPGTFVFDDVSVERIGMAPDLPAPPLAPVSASYFGTHFNFLDTPWTTTTPRFGSIRIWDGGQTHDGTGVGAQWADVNPASGQYRWSGLDKRVATARAKGADILYTLGGRTPRWASAVPDAPSPYGPGQCALPRSDKLWRTWVKAVATRYKGKIRYWEIWNEPNYAEFFCGDPTRLVALTRIARQEIGAIDPGAKIVSPSFNGVEGLSGFSQFLDLGGGALVDVIGYHFYVDQPEDMRRSALLLHAALKQHGLDRLPIWDTEQGWYDGEDPVDRFDDATAGAYVARSLLLNWLWGLSRYHYYTWDNNNRIAFTGGNRRTLTAVGRSYAFVMQSMLDARMTAATRQGDVMMLALTRGSEVTRVLWSVGAATSFSLPAAWKAGTITDVQGLSRPIEGSTVTIGPSPLFIH